jgi:TonB family protein
MKRYLLLSGSGHVLLLAGWLISSTLLSKPRMSYYAIDMVSSLPAAAPTGSKAEIKEVETPKVPPRPPVVEERKLPAKEVIKVPTKPKKAQAPPKKQGLNLKAALAVLDGQAKPTRQTSATPGTSGSPISAEAGLAFPYPWYLKTIADRLNQQWKPPKDFQEDTMCQVGFVIHRDGEVSDVTVEKASGDATFDQLAQRAVLYSNPLPPLPSGFQDEILRVHMKFVGKPF